VTALARVASDLNGALHDLFDSRSRLVMIGEDITDPYGGAFGISRGLSTKYPDRIIGTPISEAAITGMAGGMALLGDEVIVEIMFGDFITLAFDPIVNFITKSVTMYGQQLHMPVVIRCPSGGNRGYGPTHSQNMHKHFLGIPNLALHELSPLHPVKPVLQGILDRGMPAIFFEDKVLYGQPPCGSHPDDDIFEFSVDRGWGQARFTSEPADWAIIAPGGMVRRALGGMRAAVLEDEITSCLLTPTQLFPLDVSPVLPTLAEARQILVVDDGAAGGGWPVLVADTVHRALWNGLRAPVRVLQPACAVIPAAKHLEQQLLVQESTIRTVLAQRSANG
jgi:pyruvate/2-oxoglutarate/acetoin dehydrogenase E1 component